MKSKLISFLFGAIGVLLMVAALHLYNDHQNLHAIVNMIAAQSKQSVQPKEVK